MLVESSDWLRELFTVWGNGVNRLKHLFLSCSSFFSSPAGARLRRAAHWVRASGSGFAHRLNPQSGSILLSNHRRGASLFMEYKTLLGQTSGLAGKVSKSVSQKDTAKLELRKVLEAVVYALKANFPDTFEAELRSWGFRKESY